MIFFNIFRYCHFTFSFRKVYYMVVGSIERQELGMRRKFNPKRTIKNCTVADVELLSMLRSTVGYGGKPHHKKNPGDFKLDPPSDPRPNKSLCDVVKVFKKQEALNLLREGIRRGLISSNINGNSFPKNIWSVIEMEDGKLVPLESQIENPEIGTYHGYPLPPTDPMHDCVLERWRSSQCLI